MKKIVPLCLVCGAMTYLLLGVSTGTADGDRPPMLGHMVFFDLKEDTDKARENLVAACKKYLSGHEGTVHFSAGVRARDLTRAVNDLDFDVALHVVFKNRAAHDEYQKHPRHLEFIEECKESWKRVRVFDSTLTPPAESAQRIVYPDAAAHFAGMIEAKVLSKRDGQIVVLVQKVLREWRGSRAEEPKALVGKKVLVVSPKTEEDDMIARFMNGLEVGESVTLDVVHNRGEALTLLELTEEQREKVR